MILLGASEANATGMIIQLISVTLLDAQGIGNLMSEVTRDAMKALRDLKRQLVSWAQLDMEKLASALGLLARSYVKVVQKPQLQQSGAMPPAGGSED